MIAKLSTILHHNCLLETIKPVIAGVSGGADSLCLLDVLHHSGFNVVVAHLDHMLRPTSGAEAQQVERCAARYNVPFVLERADVSGYARQQGLTIEAAARVLRYGFLFRQAEKFGAQAVAVGHHADDQVETILMHLLRGAGMAGLVGMDYRSLPNAWSSRIALVRPLLGVWRSEIDAYISERGFQPVMDESNTDAAFLRNRVRHALLPELERFNPQVRQALWRMAEVLRADQAALESLLEPVYDQCTLERGAGYLALDARALAGQPEGIQRRIIRMGLSVLRPGLDQIDFEMVERAREFLEIPTLSRQADLGDGLRLSMEGETLWLADWQANLPNQEWPQVVDKAERLLPVPGQLNLAHGWLLKSEQLALTAQLHRQVVANDDPFQAWFDAGSLSFPLQVRPRRFGERMAPLGMGGRSIKLSDLMINLKVVKRARAAWPVVLSAGEVIWAPGLRQSHEHRVREASSDLVFLRLEKMKI